MSNHNRGTTERGRRERTRGISRPLAPRVSIQQYGDDHFIQTWLMDYVLRNGLSHRVAQTWHTSAGVEAIPEDVVACAAIGRYRQTLVLQIDETVAEVGIHSKGVCTAAVYGDRLDQEAFDRCFAQLREWLPAATGPGEGWVNVDFRYMTSEGPVSYRRLIEAPAWNEISGNYAADVRETIGSMASGFQPGAGGRLLLLHGPPGTGKTYVIRSLAREWRGWCSFEYITDPEAFFGSAAYMMGVLLEGASDEAQTRWRLLVLEDAGEMLSRDAKVRQGQGLSRLLNLSEGLIGQGLRVLILISTNEQLSSLNEAVARPGRTAAEVEFGPLSAEEASEWLAGRGRTETVSQPRTLAELFSLLAGVSSQRSDSRSGFGFLRR